jgi:hypothetical protein
MSVRTRRRGRGMVRGKREQKAESRKQKAESRKQ